MAQWVNRLRNKIFVNPPPLPLLCEISGALHLAQPGLTAGRQADEIQVNSKFSKLAVGQNIRLIVSFNQGTASLQPYQCIPAGFFWIKPIARLILKREIFPKPYNFLPIPTIKYICMLNKNIKKCEANQKPQWL